MSKQILSNQLNILMRDNRRSMEQEQTNSAEKFRMRMDRAIREMTDDEADYIARQWQYDCSSSPAAFEALLNVSLCLAEKQKLAAARAYADELIAIRNCQAL